MAKHQPVATRGVSWNTQFTGQKLALYSYFRSSSAWRVRIALAYKGIEYEYKPVQLLKAEQKSDEHKLINPMAQVPSLQVDDQIISQSLAIIEYLEEKYPKISIFPTDVLKRAQARQIAEMINSGIQPIQNLSVAMHVAELTDDSSKKVWWMKHYIEIGFCALEKVLEKTAGKFCVGDEVSLADLCLVPQVFNAKRCNVDVEKYPILNRINEELEKVEAFRASHPFRQPDCPEDLRETKA